MLCPKCAGQLEELTVEGEKVDACDTCEGIWFDKGEFAAVLAADAVDPAANLLDDERLDGLELPSEIAKLNEEKVGKCPTCDGSPEMTRKGRKGIFVDQCPDCHGIWLDGGEVEVLRSHFLKGVASRLGVAKGMVRSVHSVLVR